MRSADEMTTTNLRLPRAQLRALKRVAVEDPLFGRGAKPGWSRLGDLAEKHDKYLHDADRWSSSSTTSAFWRWKTGMMDTTDVQSRCSSRLRPAGAPVAEPAE